MPNGATGHNRYTPPLLARNKTARLAQQPVPGGPNAKAVKRADAELLLLLWKPLRSPRDSCVPGRCKAKVCSASARRAVWYRRHRLSVESVAKWLLLLGCQDACRILKPCRCEYRLPWTYIRLASLCFAPAYRLLLLSTAGYELYMSTKASTGVESSCRHVWRVRSAGRVLTAG